MPFRLQVVWPSVRQVSRRFFPAFFPGGSTHPTCCSLKWILPAIVSLCLAPASLGIGFQPASPDELKMTTEPLAPGAPAIVLFRQVDRDDNGHTSHEDNYVRIKILTEEGRTRPT